MSQENAEQNHPSLLDPPDPTTGSGLQHRSVRGAGRPAQKKAVGLLSPVSLVLVLLLNASADLPFLFALMLGPGLKNINISLSADAASAASRSWEGVWEAWETGGDSPCPGARLPQRCCQPDGEIGAETPPGTRRAAPALLGAGGNGGGLGTPLPTAPSPRDFPGPGDLTLQSHG